MGRPGFLSRDVPPRRRPMFELDVPVPRPPRSSPHWPTAYRRSGHGGSLCPSEGWPARTGGALASPRCPRAVHGTRAGAAVRHAPGRRSLAALAFFMRALLRTSGPPAAPLLGVRESPLLQQGMPEAVSAHLSLGSIYSFGVPETGGSVAIVPPAWYGARSTGTCRAMARGHCATLWQWMFGAFFRS